MERNQFVGERSNPMGGHWTEQWRYIDFDLNQHILRFENLEEEFRLLLRKYKLDRILKHIEERGLLHGNAAKRKVFSRTQLDADTINLIRKVYEKDFSWFG